MARTFPSDHYKHLRLLKLSPFERAPRGGWRFGTRRIGDSIVAKLIASCRAEIRGERLHQPAEAS